MEAAQVRNELVDSLTLDLVGPTSDSGNPTEVLPQAPSRWYLTGFLIPIDASDEQRHDPQETDELDGPPDDGEDEDTTPEPPAARQAALPSSMGLSVLVPKETTSIDVVVRWGEYKSVKDEAGRENWQRKPREERTTVPIAVGKPSERPVPNSDGLTIATSVRKVAAEDLDLPPGTKSVSLFLVNRRTLAADLFADEATIFQAELETSCKAGFVPRPDIRCQESDDWDERVADLQYRDAFEFSVGHGVSTACEAKADCCKVVRTCWTPQSDVERVDPAKIADVELDMDALSSLADGSDAVTKLGPLVTAYRVWVVDQRSRLAGLSPRRVEIATELLSRAGIAADRIERGIKLLTAPECLEAFRIANKCMAAAARQRQGVMAGRDPKSIQPKWRPFQLAFVLMNLPGIADPNHADREVVDLLFFPTGGGKTEAYLGLAAFTLVLRRLQNPGVAGAGLAVLMRYTLRLLTLDQLGRAATLICALEQERQLDATKLGDWPFEIGLWVGRAATPNRMGEVGGTDHESARARTIAFKNSTTNAPPIPLETCPWCGTKFKPDSFQLTPNEKRPTDLRVVCLNRDCAFAARQNRTLPIVTVDEPIYRRLPCFLIATVDKFANMPWTGEIGALFGHVDRFDKEGFYGPCETGRGSPLPGGRLPPPDLIIQDELHLISGPLGTMVGLYETALDALSSVNRDGKTIRPKIVASTATVRRAERQVRALFDRSTVDVFPPPGPNRRDSFFAWTLPKEKSEPRLYLGVAAPGRSAKVVMLRVYLALLATAQRVYEAEGGDKNNANSADPYMTLVGYFNSLRELGGARRVIEDEVNNRLATYGARRRVGEDSGAFSNRQIDYEVVELTSRITTAEVSDAKRRLAICFRDKEGVDLAIATNMISVGLDITRLGLMVVFGQPKSSSEYIQATSRVGRNPEQPGLVVTILNVHKPRDRSHFERFDAYHASFYRNVEATSVTPFSPRALDRGLAGALIALARHGYGAMTPYRGATEILRLRSTLDAVSDRFAERARSHSPKPAHEADELKRRVRERCQDLLDEWSKIARSQHEVGGALQYQTETGDAKRLLYDFLHPDLKALPVTYQKFRANRSMRDVEPSVDLWVLRRDGKDVEDSDI